MSRNRGRRFNNNFGGDSNNSESGGGTINGLWGLVVVLIITAVIVWVGASVNNLNSTMIETKTNLSNLTTAIGKIEAAQKDNVTNQALGDKMGDVYRRLDDHDRRLLLMERVPTRADRTDDGKQRFRLSH